jgi:DNA repair protein RadC
MDEISERAIASSCTEEHQRLGSHQTEQIETLPCYTTRLMEESRHPYPSRYQVASPEDVAILLKDYFKEKDREEFILLILNTSNVLVGMSVISVGGLASSIVEPRQVFKVAVLANAAAVILAHNHPSGNPEPSREDIRITRQLVDAGKLMGIPVHDHLIMAGETYTSLAERELLD